MRYFIEVAYKGTHYAGFQIQKNANTIQAEVEKALQTCFRKNFKLTGSSRTDAGVHANQNYFHVDVDVEIPAEYLYNLNSLLPADIAIKQITLVQDDAHCRFDALSREYRYYIYSSKDPFINETAWYYPYKIDFDALNVAAETIVHFTDFTSFSKRNTQTHTNLCTVTRSIWEIHNGQLIYTVKANRFLRGMVRGLVGTMLQVARGTISVSGFIKIAGSRDCTRVSFATPAKGLFLAQVSFPESIIPGNFS